MRPLVVALVASLLAAPPLAAADGSDALRTFITELRTAQADFRQTVYDDEQGTLLSDTVTGSMRLLRPRYLFWEYDAPQRMVLAADGEQFWVYDPELQQATVQPLADALAGTPLRLLLDDSSDPDSWQISPLQQRLGLDWLRVATPDSIQEWTLGLRDGTLEYLMFTNDLGHRVQLQLTNLTINRALDPGSFAYQPPPGTDILARGDS